MDAEGWRRVKEAFAAVVDLPAGEREAWLAAHFAEDPELQEEVRDLLAAHEQADFLEPGALAADPDLQRALETASPGLEIGPYRVISEIGRGGMGAVYLAERADAEFPQTVAVKLIKRGMDSAEIVRRFVHERRILAGLAHPNIARLLDGGSTADGRPYFVMEQVEGVPITTFTRQQKLGVEARLRLFLKICGAVQYAHQHLIVHRDLKPANILVGDDGEPKLLDFGIAKLLDPAGGTALTELGQKPMTPDYASPEQLAGEPVTTATDVYALGILLYELLVGRSAAHLHKELGEGWRERLPSQVADRLADDPSSRGLARLLRGDLDAVVGKALAGDPRQRYGTAAALAADLERHLAQEPVHARRPTLAYRWGRAVVRHKLASGFVLAVLVFAALSSWQAYRIGRERDRSTGLYETLVDIFLHSSDPDTNRGKGMDHPGFLNAGVRRLTHPAPSDPLRAEPELRANLLQVVGNIYLNRSLYEDAANALKKAETLLARRTDRESRLALAGILTRQGNVYLAMEDRASSHRAFRRAIRLKRDLLGPRALSLVDDLTGLGRLETEENRFGRAALYLNMALGLCREADPPAPRRLAETLSHLGNLAAEEERFEPAEAFLQEARSIFAATLGEDHPDTVGTRADLATVLHQAGDYPRAEKEYREVLATLRRLFPPDHADIAVILINLGSLHQDRGHVAEAESTLREALAMRARLGLEPDEREAKARNSLALVLLRKGDLEGAEAEYERAFQVLETLYRGRNQELANVANGLARVKRRQGDLAGAEAQARRALALYPRRDDPEAGDAWNTLARILLEAHRPAEAEAAFRQAVALRRQTPRHPDLPILLIALGAFLFQRERPAEAEPPLAEAVALRREARPFDPEKLAQAEKWLAACRAEIGRPKP